MEGRESTPQPTELRVILPMSCPLPSKPLTSSGDSLARAPRVWAAENIRGARNHPNGSFRWPKVVGLGQRRGWDVPRVLALGNLYRGIVGRVNARIAFEMDIAIGMSLLVFDEALDVLRAGSKILKFADVYVDGDFHLGQVTRIVPVSLAVCPRLMGLFVVTGFPYRNLSVRIGRSGRFLCIGSTVLGGRHEKQDGNDE